MIMWLRYRKSLLINTEKRLSPHRQQFIWWHTYSLSSNPKCRGEMSVTLVRRYEKNGKPPPLQERGEVWMVRHCINKPVQPAIRIMEKELPEHSRHWPEVRWLPQTILIC